MNCFGFHTLCIIPVWFLGNHRNHIQIFWWLPGIICDLILNQGRLNDGYPGGHWKIYSYNLLEKVATDGSAWFTSHLCQFPTLALSLVQFKNWWGLKSDLFCLRCINIFFLNNFGCCTVKLSGCLGYTIIAKCGIFSDYKKQRKTWISCTKTITNR